MLYFFHCPAVAAMGGSEVDNLLTGISIQLSKPFGTGQKIKVEVRIFSVVFQWTPKSVGYCAGWGDPR